MAVDERISKTASMENLPKIALSNVAAYLEATTRALLAVALSAPPSSWEKCGWAKEPSSASKIVMTSPYYRRYYGRGQYDEHWDKLDFWDVDKSVRNKLTDGDVCGILVCINARNNLKILRFPQCIRIRGDGLSPLRGSLVLEEIDLNMGRYEESPSIEPKPVLAEDTVLPILHSILDTGGTSLKYLRLPKMWREEQSEDVLNVTTFVLVRWYRNEMERMGYKISPVMGARNTFVNLAKTTFNSALAVK
ncbi:hypothetical protein ACHAXR_008386 [Thalassiosira sp. AJA248-18]